MKKHQYDYKVVPYPKLRRLLSLMMGLVRRKHMIHGLIEVDVTKARAHLSDHKVKTGESLSFTAFITVCLAQAIDENKSLQACRKGSKHLVLFDEVDVAAQIERDVAGHSQNITYIIRAANKKTFREIHHEIRTAQVEEVEQAWGSLACLSLDSVRAAGGLQMLLANLLVDAWKVSPDAKEIPWDGGYNGSGDVWERGRLGHPYQRPYTRCHPRRHR